jgi:hypothetical protein
MRSERMRSMRKSRSHGKGFHYAQCGGWGSENGSMIRTHAMKTKQSQRCVTFADSDPNQIDHRHAVGELNLLRGTYTGIACVGSVATRDQMKYQRANTVELRDDGSGNLDGNRILMHPKVQENLASVCLRKIGIVQI